MVFEFLNSNVDINLYRFPLKYTMMIGQGSDNNFCCHLQDRERQHLHETLSSYHSSKSHGTSGEWNILDQQHK